MRLLHTADWHLGKTLNGKNLLDDQKFILDELFKVVDDQKPDAILIEDHSTGSPLIDECKRRGMTGIIGRRSSTDKATRMYGETAKLQAGSLVLPKAAPWLDEFLMEYLAFPGGRHDDQIDALSQFLIWRTEAETIPPLIWDIGDGDDGGGDNDDSGNGGGTPELSAPSPEQFLWHLRW